MARRELTATEEIATTLAEMAADIDPMRQLWAKLVETESVIARGTLACKQSRKLLAQIEHAHVGQALIDEPPAEVRSCMAENERAT
jgi:hypothetical protein